MPVAFITGGARGIGAATGRALAASGWRVALIDSGGMVSDAPGGPPPSTAEQLEEAVASCEGAAVGIAADVRSARSLNDAVVEARGELGVPDAAVAAAGRIGAGRGWETDPRVWEEMLAVNLHGVRYLAEAVMPDFLEGGGPRRFVAVSSASAAVGLERLAAYSAAKSAVAGYIRSLAADLRGTETTANAICPGSTDTAMLEASAEIYDLDGPDEFASHQLLERLLEPEEVAAMIAFLCGPGGSGITGAVLPVDGGMTV